MELTHFMFPFLSSVSSEDRMPGRQKMLLLPRCLLIDADAETYLDGTDEIGDEEKMSFKLP